MRGSCLYVAATGTGKTRVGSEVVARWLNHIPGSRVLILAGRIEIIKQLTTSLEFVGVLVGVECGSQISTGEPVVVGSICGVRPGTPRFNRVLRPSPPSLVVVDECHHSQAPTWRAVLDALPPHARLGLTATPNRSDGLPLRELFAEVACEYSREQGIRDGHLTPFREVRAESVRELTSLAGSRRTIVYCTSVDASQELARCLTSLGVSAVHADGSTMSPRERARALTSFASGEVQYLTNCQLVTEGWDVPGVECVAVMRGCGSPTMMSQMLGRGLRSAPGKSECLFVLLPDQVPLDILERRSPSGSPGRAPPSGRGRVPVARIHTPGVGLGRRFLGWLGL